MLPSGEPERAAGVGQAEAVEHCDHHRQQHQKRPEAEHEQ